MHRTLTALTEALSLLIPFDAASHDRAKSVTKPDRWRPAQARCRTPWTAERRKRYPGR